ncbi:phosphopantetheine-binding protein, partial [Streptosporangium carneum]
LPPPHTCTPLPHHHTNTDTTNGADTDAQKTGDAAADTSTDHAVSPLHHTLTHIWTEVLGVPSVSPKDNFFTLGGHSLAAVRLLFLVRDRLKVELALRDLYETDDFAAFAARVEQLLPGGAPAGADGVPDGAPDAAPDDASDGADVPAESRDGR